MIAHDPRWLGVFAEGRFAAITGYTVTNDRIDMDRLAVPPAYVKLGMGVALVRQASAGRHTTLSTGTANAPNTTLGFTAAGRREIAPGVGNTTFEFVPQA